MANTTGKNPIVADTAGTTLASGEVLVQAFCYLAGTAAGAAVQLLDGSAGDILFDAKGAANTTVTLSLPDPIRVSGLYLQTLEANGKLLIYTWPSKGAYVR